jgi:hypothetical protein
VVVFLAISLPTRTAIFVGSKRIQTYKIVQLSIPSYQCIESLFSLCIFSPLQLSFLHQLFSSTYHYPVFFFLPIATLPTYNNQAQMIFYVFFSYNHLLLRLLPVPFCPPAILTGQLSLSPPLLHQKEENSISIYVPSTTSSASPLCLLRGFPQCYVLLVLRSLFSVLNIVEKGIEAFF